MAQEPQMDFKDGFAVKNKWIADIDLSKISPDLKKITLHLADFTIPGINIGSASSAYKGISLDVPTHVMLPADRTVIFSYMVDITWLNYFSLYQWTNLLGNVENITPSIDPLRISDPILYKAVKSIPINVYLLNSYKTPILKIAYDNCWIKHFTELNISYQEEPEVIKHSFTLSYSNFRLEQIPV
jgi:hypothetical protein